MKAYTIDRYSKEDRLALTDVPMPAIKPDEVLVEVHAASVNPLDEKIKNGDFKLLLPYKFPLILGHDVAGVITKVGAKVTGFKVGDAVYARPSDFHIGAFAEYIAIPQQDVALKPKNMSFEQAAALPLVALTAWQAFTEKAKVKAGQKVFIQSGSGGVGTIAIQLAHLLGAKVATTTSARNFELVKSLGADVPIDYRTQHFETILKDYDVVLNSQDEATLQKSIGILKPGGKLVSISGPPSVAFAKEAGLPWYMKAIFYFLSRKVITIAKKNKVDYAFLFMQASGKQLAEITALVESNKLVPVIDKVFPFAETNEAIDYVATGRTKGKVVIAVKQMSV